MNLKAAIEDLHRMRDISVQLHELNFKAEEHLEQLAVLQQEQALLRDRLTPWISQLGQDADTREIIQECIVLEQSLHDKLTECQDWVKEQIYKLRIGTMSKNAYSDVYYQTEGYFVDRKK
ncbi:hypothetical protein ACFQZR_07880 [Paenibacillus sp. GCM10027629]|uniref:hypothetical protein n=1 Tax=Paenibacillus sp. GCM10027629 TaxID=3273414 RepID=UPI003624E79C